MGREPRLMDASRKGRRPSVSDQLPTSGACGTTRCAMPYMMRTACYIMSCHGSPQSAVKELCNIGMTMHAHSSMRIFRLDRQQCSSHVIVK